MIATGEKLVENRCWATNHRGALAIHAGRSRSWLHPGDLIAWPNMRFGVIVAITNLVACIGKQDVDAGNLPADLRWVREHQYTEGPWCWIFDVAWSLRRPIPCRGQPRLFDVPDHRLEEAFECPSNPARTC